MWPCAWPEHMEEAKCHLHRKASSGVSEHFKIQGVSRTLSPPNIGAGPLSGESCLKLQ